MNEDQLIGLIYDIARKDENAFKTLYELTNKKVYQYLFRLTYNQHMAEDLLIETYTEVWKVAKNYRSQAKVLTWMIGISRNIAMNDFRRKKMKEWDLDEDTAIPPEQFIAYKNTEISLILGDALNRLSIKHREVLDLVFLQGMGYEEISCIINIPINTVKTRVFYAKENLKRTLTQMGIEKDDIL